MKKLVLSLFALLVVATACSSDCAKKSATRRTQDRSVQTLPAENK